MVTISFQPLHPGVYHGGKISAVRSPEAAAHVDCTAPLHIGDGSNLDVAQTTDDAWIAGSQCCPHQAGGAVICGSFVGVGFPPPRRIIDLRMIE